MTQEGSKEDLRAVTLHERVVYVDTHCDSIMAWMPSVRLPSVMRRDMKVQPQRSLGQRTKIGHVDLPGMIEGDVDCQVFAVYTPRFFIQCA